MPRFVNFVRRHGFILALIAVIGATRFVILALSQTHVHSDEAIIGLMGKHISEGRYFPFYMYGQPYNAAAAGEAYLAVIPFKLFGVGVLSLKSVIVVLSLVCLALFYQMAKKWYDERTAIFSTVVFALAPSLLKWHFQVRGYSFYFLSIPVLLILFCRSIGHARTRDLILFGVVSGLSVWLLELSLTLVAALGLFILLWRRMSIQQIATALAAFLTGYAPAIVYNLIYHFANWQAVFLKAGGQPRTNAAGALRPSNLGRIVIDEMPKFFGPDTILWYFPEKPWTGFVCYGVALIAVAAALLAFVRRPAQIRTFISAGGPRSDQDKDLFMLALTAACFIPYLLVPIATPSYFFGGIFFLSLLTGRLLAKCFSASGLVHRLLGWGITMSILSAGVGAIIEVAKRNEIETLSLCDQGKTYCMTRIPGADIAAVEKHLRTFHITSAWTTLSLVCPLLFETGESIAISDAMFGWERRVYPKQIPPPQLRGDHPPVVVMETNFPNRPEIEARLAEVTGAPPLVAQYGTLVVIEQR